MSRVLQYFREEPPNRRGLLERKQRSARNREESDEPGRKFTLSSCCVLCTVACEW